MIRDKDAPDEVIHIRQAWIKAINRVAEAIAYRYKRDVNDQYRGKSGIETVVETVIALKCILVDYGEATVASDVIEWHNKNIDTMKKGDMNRMSFYRKWFEYMVQTLNRYGMLFDSQPKGYTNTEMRSIHEDGAS
jgi:hypothetical protein